MCQQQVEHDTLGFFDEKLVQTAAGTPRDGLVHSRVLRQAHQAHTWSPRVCLTNIVQKNALGACCATSLRVRVDTVVPRPIAHPTYVWGACQGGPGSVYYRRRPRLGAVYLFTTFYTLLKAIHGEDA